MTWCTRVKIAVVAPIPRVRVMTAVVVTPGAFLSCRNASRKSLNTGAPYRVLDIRRVYADYRSRGHSCSSPIGPQISDRKVTSRTSMVDCQCRRELLETPEE